MQARLTGFFLLLFCMQTIRAQSPVSSLDQSKNTFQFDIDYASFRAPSDQVLLEVYYSFYHDNLRFVDQDSEQVAVFHVDARIFQGDSLRYSRDWFGKSVIGNDEALAKSETFYTLSTYTLPPGQYRLVTRIRDATATIEGSREIEVKLESFSEDALSISDIELATSLAKDSSVSVFTKNDYRVIPNVSAVCSYENPMLYFYAEIYNLMNKDGSTYSVEYSISDREHQKVRSYPAKIRPKMGSSVVEVAGLNVISLRPGVYELNLKVIDNANESFAVRTKKFLVIRASDYAARQQAGMYAAYKNATLEQLDEEFTSAAYLTNRAERNAFAGLDLEGKRSYLVDFWSRHDNDPASGRREVRAAHLQRLTYAKTHFRGRNKGWDSDRGRVIVKYGMPDEVEKNSSLAGKKSYEIWRYYTQEGGLMFVFVEKGRLTDMDLVHSNAPGESYDPNWIRWIQL